MAGVNPVRYETEMSHIEKNEGEISRVARAIMAEGNPARGEAKMFHIARSGTGKSKKRTESNSVEDEREISRVARTTREHSKSLPNNAYSEEEVDYSEDSKNGLHIRLK